MAVSPRFCFAALFAALLVAGAAGQTSNCTSATSTLTPCLTYVAGSDPAPSFLCCTGIALLNTNNPDCLCQVVAQLNNGSITPGVNVTRAYALPDACGVTVNTANCPAFALPPASIAPTPPPLSSSPAPPPPATAKAPGSPTGSPASITRPSPWVAVLGALAVLGVSVCFSDFWVGAFRDF